MNSLLKVLKQKKVWIPLSIFLVMFATIATGTYFISRSVVQASEETPDFPLNEILLASIDPSKRKHLQKGEVLYFEAEKAIAERKYRRASEYFAECAEQFSLAAGKDSRMACIMQMRQAQFESQHGKLREGEAVLRRALSNLGTGEKSADMRLSIGRWLGYVLQCQRKYKDAIAVMKNNVTEAEHMDKVRHLIKEPNRTGALKALESCYAGARQYEDAYKIAGQVLEIAQRQPDNKKLVTDAWIEIGRIRTYSGKAEAAIDAYEKALNVDPQCKEAYRARGMAYNEQRQYRNAISDFSIVIRIDPRDENAFEWRAYDYDCDGDREKAIEDLTQAIKVGGNNSSVFDNRARLHAELGQYKEAVADYADSLEIEEDPWTYMYRGKAYEQLSQYQNAIDDYSKALESKYFLAHPNETTSDKTISANFKTMGALVYAKRAKCYDKLGKKDRAQEDRAKSNELDKAQPDQTAKYRPAGNAENQGETAGKNGRPSIDEPDPEAEKPELLDEHQK